MAPDTRSPAVPPIPAGGSHVVDRCQVCGGSDLRSVLFLGYLPPVNTMPAIGSRPCEQPAYPAEMLECPRCRLFQLGLAVSPEILFPPSYPYTSGTTKILRDNFAELYQEVMQLHPLKQEDLVIDVGSNDGTLLSNFHAGGHRVLGIEPTNAGQLAIERGIATHIAFFDRASADAARREHGEARVVTATNVFAHIWDPHAVVENVLRMLADDGVFISESHYLLPLVETVQYDTIYHEHLRYYSVTSLRYLLESHGLEIVHVRRIPTHGGSVRVYAMRRGKHPVQASVAAALEEEASAFGPEGLRRFKSRVVASKLSLHALLRDIRVREERVYGVGAPSRASTLINYVGLDDGILDCVTEIPGSYKIGKYIPGTIIPVLGEGRLYAEQPEYALLLSWHIADELVPKLTAQGFRGKFIVPLPEPRIVAPG